MTKQQDHLSIERPHYGSEKEFIRRRFHLCITVRHHLMYFYELLQEAEPKWCIITLFIFGYCAKIGIIIS